MNDPMATMTVRITVWDTLHASVTWSMCESAEKSVDESMRSVTMGALWESVWRRVTDSMRRSVYGYMRRLP